MKLGTQIITSLLNLTSGDNPIISYAVIDYRSSHRPLLELHHTAGNVQASIKTSFDPAEIEGVRMGMRACIKSYAHPEKNRKTWPALLTASADYFSADDSSAWMRWELLNGVRIGEEYENTLKVACKLDQRLATLETSIFRDTPAIVAEARNLPPIDGSLSSYSSEGRKELYAVPKNAIENAALAGEAAFLETLEHPLKISIRTPLVELTLPEYSFGTVTPAKLRALEHDYHRGYLDSNPDQVGADILSSLAQDIRATEKLSAAILDNLPDLDRLTADIKHRAERLEAARQKPSP